MNEIKNNRITVGRGFDISNCVIQCTREIDTEGFFTQMSKEGELVMIYYVDKPTKEEIDWFKYGSVKYKIFSNHQIAMLLLDGFISAEAPFDPCKYKDDRVEKFISKDEMVVPVLLVDKRTEKVVAIRELYMDMKIKIMCNLIMMDNLVRNNPHKVFLEVYRKSVLSVPLCTLIDKAPLFGEDKQSKFKEKIELSESLSRLFTNIDNMDITKGI